MAESICRALRDGALEGEHAPALTIMDSIASPFGLHVFSHILFQHLSHILEGKSQSRGLVIVTFSKSHSFYLELLKRKGVNVASSHKWIHILDCYSDPLGWKDRTSNAGNIANLPLNTSLSSTSCKNVRDSDKLFSSIIELGKGLVGQSKVRFSVAIDSVSEMLRYASISSISGLLSDLRSHDQISSLFWLLHSDLHENRITSVLEYISSMVSRIEPIKQSPDGQKGILENMSFLEQNLRKGKFNIRFKRRNGRVRVMCEEFNIEHSGISFTSISSEDGIINHGFLPKVQFNLQLSEKERTDRANVVLPFEHQGNGQPIQIYDGRRSLIERENEEEPISSGNLQPTVDSGKGEIIYFRDSDDEMPDSDEDPDDDLDI
ncbi:elongator complex protein 5 [Quillaja saponaria]|uniref:Elongator complex protein 5 n=1 Tax=Quillaja saponaria TaxID=32244 RepID=A0AAD7LKF0_QUISA|nr:elongator complex protein 5 [Quillaja saponaria]